MPITSQAYSLHCGLFLETHLSLSCKTIRKPTKAMLRAGKNHDKLTNKELLVPPDSSCFLQTPKLELLVLRFSMAGALVWDFLLLVAFSILSFLRHQRLEILHRKWTFPQAGPCLRWEVVSAERRNYQCSMLLCWTFRRDVPCCPFQIWVICGAHWSS